MIHIPFEPSCERSEQVHGAKLHRTKLNAAHLTSYKLHITQAETAQHTSNRSHALVAAERTRRDRHVAASECTHCAALGGSTAINVSSSACQSHAARCSNLTCKASHVPALMLDTASWPWHRNLAHDRRNRYHHQHQHCRHRRLHSLVTHPSGTTLALAHRTTLVRV